MSRKDNTAKEWFTFAGPKRGRVKNALSVVYNLGDASKSAIADQVDAHGINPVIDHPDFGIVFWGNSTLYKTQTLLKHANVAELMVFMQKALKPLVQSELFDPNDIQTWKTIYRNVKPLLDYIKTQRGIWAYLYQGDQDVDDVSECVVNQQSNIDAGQYIFNLFVSPKVGMKYQGVKVILTNSGVNFEALAATNVF
jgi:phage tail sheath protein FI